jgi:hypothetical protein
MTGGRIACIEYYKQYMKRKFHGIILMLYYDRAQKWEQETGGIVHGGPSNNVFISVVIINSCDQVRGQNCTSILVLVFRSLWFDPTFSH